MNKNKNVMASYDPMTATNHNMLDEHGRINLRND